MSRPTPPTVDDPVGSEPPDDPRAALRSLRTAPAHLVALVPAAEEGTFPEWERLLEALRHLAEGERLLRRAAEAMDAGGAPPELSTPPADEAGDAGLAVGSQTSPAELLEGFRRSRSRTVALLESLPMGRWLERVPHRAFGEVEFGDYVGFVSAHERTHLQQIEGMLSGAPRPNGETPFLPHLEIPYVRERRDATARGPLRLTSNENRLGLPETVRCAVIDAFADAHIYPDDSAVFLTRALADRHGIDPEGIVHAHGSSDLLRICAAAAAVGRPPLRLVLADPTFEHLVAYAEPYGVELVHVRVRDGSFAHDVEGMKRAAESGGKPALVYICNPNNPTGTLTPVDEIERWIEGASEDHFFIVDEAYCEYVDDPSYHSLDRFAWEHPNVVVLRTFSKIYGMAGVRVGYAVAHPRTAGRLKQFKSGRGPNHLGNMAALAALSDPTLLPRARAANLESRRIVYEVLEELGLGWMDSHTNFVMHEVGGDVEAYVERMREAGFLVGRPFSAFPRHNRISLGTPGEMRSWAEALRTFRERGWV